MNQINEHKSRKDGHKLKGHSKDCPKAHTGRRSLEIEVVKGNSTTYISLQRQWDARPWLWPTNAYDQSACQQLVQLPDQTLLTSTKLAFDVCVWQDINKWFNLTVNLFILQEYYGHWTTKWIMTSRHNYALIHSHPPFSFMLSQVRWTAKGSSKPEAEFHQKSSVSDGGTNTGKHTHKCLWQMLKSAKVDLMKEPCVPSLMKDLFIQTMFHSAI